MGSVTVSADGKLTLIGCRLKCRQAKNDIYVGKRASVSALETRFVVERTAGVHIRAQHPRAVAVHRCEFGIATGIFIELSTKGPAMESCVVSESHFRGEGILLLRGTLPAELKIHDNDFRTRPSWTGAPVMVNNPHGTKVQIRNNLLPTAEDCEAPETYLKFFPAKDHDAQRAEYKAIGMRNAACKAVNGVELTIIGTAEEMGSHAMKHGAETWGERGSRVLLEVVPSS